MKLRLSSSTAASAALVFLATVIIVHAMNLVSPLRLNNDVIRLLELAWAHAFPSEGPSALADQYPPGYPVILSLLFRQGLQAAGWIHALSLGLLLLALADWWIVLRRELAWPVFATAGAISALLLNWIVIKHLPLALTDVPYLALAMISLNAALRCWRRTGREAWVWGLIAFFTGGLATTVRTVGVTLLGAVAVTLLFHPIVRSAIGREWDRGPARRAAWLGAGVVMLVAGALVTVKSSWFDQQFRRPGSYFQSLRSSTGNQTWGTVLKTNIAARASELAEVTLNVPATKLRLPRAGIVMLGLAAGAMFAREAARRVGSHFPLIAYLASIGALLLVWAYYDSRFMLPLVPPLLVLAGEAARAWRARLSRLAFGIFAGFYAVLGALALGYSVRLTFSGDRFPERYGGGSFAREHAVARGERMADGPLDHRAVILLQRHDAESVIR